MTRLRRVEPVVRLALMGACRVPRGARVLVAVSGGAHSGEYLAFSLPESEKRTQ